MPRRISATAPPIAPPAIKPGLVPLRAEEINTAFLYKRFPITYDFSLESVVPLTGSAVATSSFDPLVVTAGPKLGGTEALPADVGFAMTIEALEEFVPATVTLRVEV